MDLNALNLDFSALTNTLNEFYESLNITNMLEQWQIYLEQSQTLISERIILFHQETDVDAILKLSNLYLENKLFKSILESESIENTWQQIKMNN
mgnify:CR=1 FL=1